MWREQAFWLRCSVQQPRRLGKGGGPGGPHAAVAIPGALAEAILTGVGGHRAGRRRSAKRTNDAGLPCAPSLSSGPALPRFSPHSPIRSRPLPSAPDPYGALPAGKICPSPFTRRLHLLPYDLRHPFASCRWRARQYRTVHSVLHKGTRQKVSVSARIFLLFTFALSESWLLPRA